MNVACDNGHAFTSPDDVIALDPCPRCGATMRVQPLARFPEHIEQFFAWEHLPPHLAAVSRPFGELAQTIITTLPRNAERTVALRKLLEAKDAAVRAKLAKDVA